tara:strand:- start:511 stop:927 length:417 start_codon:yes stop_codon:yes gene_type:complete
MNIEDKILKYKEELDFFEDTMDKYKYLLDQGKNEQEFPEEYRSDSFLVKGCQAQVWLVPKYEKEIIYFLSDSDAFISKGMVTILANIYGNRSPEEILSSDFEKLKLLGLDSILTTSRRNGVNSMLEYIKKYALKFSKK